MQFQGASGPVLTRANLNLSDSSFFSPKRSSSYLGERSPALVAAKTADEKIIRASVRMRLSLRITTSRFWILDFGLIGTNELTSLAFAPQSRFSNGCKECSGCRGRACPCPDCAQHNGASSPTAIRATTRVAPTLHAFAI